MKEPSIDLQGFKFFDSFAGRWEFQPNLQVTSCGELLKKFYHEWKWGKRPLGFKRNPEDHEGKRFYPFDDVIVCPYRKNFYVVIERKFNEIFGPHTVRLFYRSYEVPTETAWVAIFQISCNWHSDERVLLQMLEGIASKEFYQSEKTAETIVLV